MNKNEKTLRNEIRKMVSETLSELEMDTKRKSLKPKGGLTTQALGGTVAMKYAEDFIQAIEGLDDTKKAKAIGLVLASIGMDVTTLQANLGRIKTGIRQYTPKNK